MDVTAVAALQVQAMVLSSARAPLEQIQSQPLPANASASEQADVILELSSAAQQLTTLGA